MTVPGEGKLRSEYARLESLREPYLRRGRDCAQYTITSLMPPTGATGATKLKTGYASFGARLVNSLAAKLTLALFPAQAPFFKYTVDDAALEALGQMKQRPAVEQALARMERLVVDVIETSASRPTASLASKHLIVVGNCLAHITESHSLRVFPLSQYVVKRDFAGQVMLTILEESVSMMALSPEIRALVKDKHKGGLPSSDRDDSADPALKLYTGIYRRGNHWEIWQEIEDILIPSSRNTQPLDACPWLPLRWSAVDGEDYGRSMVEDHLGDLVSYEGLTKSLVEGTAASARVLFLRNPNGTLKAADFARARTGDIVNGKEGDVVTVQSEKRADFITARETLNDIKEQLSYAFALNQAIQRNAERVTAEEIRFMANDLDSNLGGIYSSLSVEFQLPYLKRLTRQLERAGVLPVLPKGMVKPVIVTGIAALGRGAELENIKAFVAEVVEMGGPEGLKTYVNFSVLMKRLAVARGLRVDDGLVYSDEEVAQNQQQQQMAQLVEQLGPNAVTGAAGIAKQAMTQQGSQNG